MNDILDYVVFNLKEQQLLDKLNGGIILTGGGSQLKHLSQLTEFKTGLPARIGLPNEHLAGGHINELMKPMYATAIGLILRGYDDYEQNRQRFVSFNNDTNVIPTDHTKPVSEAPKEVAPETSVFDEYFKDFPTSSTDSVPFVEELDSTTSGESNLFSQPEATAPNPEVENEKARVRMKLISSIFGMVNLGNVKKKVIETFEKFDDKPLN